MCNICSVDILSSLNSKEWQQSKYFEKKLNTLQKQPPDRLHLSRLFSCSLRSNLCSLHVYAIVLSLGLLFSMDIGYVLKIIIYSQNQNIEMRREAVIRSLILYLGEKEEELFEDCQVKRFLFNVMLKMLQLYYRNVHQGWGTNAPGGPAHSPTPPELKS